MYICTMYVHIYACVCTCEIYNYNINKLCIHYVHYQHTELVMYMFQHA